jgi:hypothetical protein
MELQAGNPEPHVYLTICPDPVHTAEFLVDRTQLNNYLQQIFGNQTTLSWDSCQIGPEHSCDWEAIACSAYTAMFQNIWTLTIVVK